MQAPFVPANHELVVDSIASVSPSAPIAPQSVTNDDARKAELQALVHVCCHKILVKLILYPR